MFISKMIKVSRYGAACFLNTPFINLIYWYRSDILYFLMSLHRANQRMTGIGIEKTKSESFYQIRRKVKLRFYYQKECFLPTYGLLSHRDISKKRT